MIRHILLTIAAVALTTGCATTHHQGANNGDYNDETPVVENLDRELPRVSETKTTEQDRGVAQVGVPRWIADSKSATINPQGGTVNVVLSPRQVMTEEVKYRYTCEIPGWGQTTCQDWDCGSGGKSDLWNAYYNGPRESKVAALDAALKGVSGSARRLHESGIFSRSKPRSWPEFRERMNEALRKNVITANEYNEVFGTHGLANRANLGYAGETCVEKTYRCEVWGLFTVVDGCVGTKTKERVLNVFNKPVRATFRNPQLQSFETETVTISAGPDFDSIQVSGGDKTQYRLVSKQPVGDGADMVFEGVSRIQIPLPAQSLKGATFNDTAGGPLKLFVNVDHRAVGTGDDKLILTVNVSHCESAPWYAKFGDCKGSDKNKVALPTISRHLIKGGQSFVDLENIPAGRKVFVGYTIHRQNSRWYTNAPVGVRAQKLKDLKK